MTTSQTLVAEMRRREAELLRKEGVSYRQIAETLGVSSTTVVRYLNPEYAAKENRLSREAKQRRRGICAGCGGPTRYSGKQTATSLRCDSCARAASKIWTREVIIDAILRFSHEEGRPPTAHEWMLANPEKRYPASSSVYGNGVFASWNEAIAAAGLQPVPAGHYRRNELRRRKMKESVDA